MTTKMTEKIKMKVCHSYSYFRLIFNYLYFAKKKKVLQGIFYYTENKFMI